jgi:hypothetical protein
MTGLTDARLNEAAVEHLRKGFAGRLLQPSEERNEEARAIWNGAIGRRPALIARCTGTADVLADIQVLHSELVAQLKSWWATKRRLKLIEPLFLISAASLEACPHWHASERSARSSLPAASQPPPSGRRLNVRAAAAPSMIVLKRRQAVIRSHALKLNSSSRVTDWYCVTSGF